MKKIKEKFYQFLRWTEKYTKTDMVYFFEGSFWWIFGRVFSFLASFLLFFVFGRFVSKEIFGIYQYVLSMAGILGLFSLGGINTALIRAIAKGIEGSFLPAMKERFKFGMLGSFFSFLISLWYFLHGNYILGTSFLILGIFLPFLATFASYGIFWQGKKRFDVQNKYFVSQNFLAVFILICFILLFRENAILIVFGYFFAFTISELIFFLKTIKNIKNIRDTHIEKETISFGKHLTIMMIPTTFSLQIDKVILWQFLGPVQLAIYTFGLRIVQRISEIVPFSALALPKLSERDVRKIKRGILEKFLKLFLISIPLTLIYVLICPLFFKIFFPAYLDSVPYSQVLSLILLFSPFSFLATSFLAEAKKRELYILNFAPQILKIVLFFILIPLFGIWGAVFSILFSQIFYSALTLYLFKKL